MSFGYATTGKMQGFGSSWAGKSGPKGGLDFSLVLKPSQLKAARAYSGLTQAELARLVGVGARIFSNYEQGLSRCGGEVARRITLVLMERGIFVVCEGVEAVYAQVGVKRPDVVEGIVIGEPTTIQYS